MPPSRRTRQKWTAMKIAATSGDSRWVSSGESREWAHHQRALADAIMVGVNTVLVDNPRLTARPEAA